MELFFNGENIATLSAMQTRVIKNDIPEEIFESDMARRCKYWLESPIFKKAKREKGKITRELVDKGITTIPLNSISLFRSYCEEFPCLIGYADIKGSIVCKVGKLSFDLSEDYRIGWRKFRQARQKMLTEKEFYTEESLILKTRMSYILFHKYEKCMERLKLEWCPRLASIGLSEIPSSDEEFAELVFSQPDYKDRSQRDAEEEGKE